MTAEERHFSIEVLKELKMFLKQKQLAHNIYGLTSKYLKEPDKAEIKLMFETDQNNLDTVIRYLKAAE